MDSIFQHLGCCAEGLVESPLSLSLADHGNDRHRKETGSEQSVPKSLSFFHALAEQTAAIPDMSIRDAVAGQFQGFRQRNLVFNEQPDGPQRFGSSGPVAELAGERKGIDKLRNSRL